MEDSHLSGSALRVVDVHVVGCNPFVQGFVQAVEPVAVGSEEKHGEPGVESSVESSVERTSQS